MEEVAGQKRSRSDSAEPESLPEFSEAKRIRADLLLDILDDDDADGGQADDLATVMRSLEEEISLPPPPPPPASELTAAVLDDPPQPDLGYLLEASDDELGLPPAYAASSFDGGAEADAPGAEALPEDAGFGGKIWALEDDIGFGYGYGYGSEFGIRPEAVGPEEGVVFDDGLFDYSDVFCGPSDLAEMPWRSETLPAL